MSRCVTLGCPSCSRISGTESSASASSRSTERGARAASCDKRKGRAFGRGLCVELARDLLRRHCWSSLWRSDGRVGRWRPALGLSLATALLLLLLRLGRLVGELDLTLAEFLHHQTPCFLVFGVVDRRPVEGLAEAGERNREGHGLLLHVHGSDDHLLALAHLVEHFLGQLHLDLTACRKADGILQLDGFAVVDLDL